MSAPVALIYPDSYNIRANGIEANMELIKTEIGFNFINAQKPWLVMRDLIRLASQDEGAEVQASPMVMEQEKEKKKVTLQVRGLIIELEQRASAAEAAKEIQSLVAQFHETSPLPEVRLVTFEQLFIEPISLPILDLVNGMKKMLLKESRVVLESTDIAISLDRNEGDILRHLELGPMEPEQLTSQLLRWPRAKTPDVFAFLKLQYVSKKEEPFTLEKMDAFIKTALDWQQSEATRLLGELREELA